MPASGTVRELEKRMKYNTAAKTNKTESTSSEKSRRISAHWGNVKKESEARIPTQKEVDEQIRKNFIPLG